MEDRCFYFLFMVYMHICMCVWGGGGGREGRDGMCQRVLFSAYKNVKALTREKSQKIRFFLLHIGPFIPVFVYCIFPKNMFLPFFPKRFA